MQLVKLHFNPHTQWHVKILNIYTTNANKKVNKEHRPNASNAFPLSSIFVQFISKRFCLSWSLLMRIPIKYIPDGVIKYYASLA